MRPAAGAMLALAGMLSACAAASVDSGVHAYEGALHPSPPPPPPPGGARPAVPVVPAGLERAVPPGMQYLYGSGEAAAQSIQTWSAVAVFAAKARKSVVAAGDVTGGDTRFVPCGRKPRAVVLDVDETGLLNYGYEYSDAKRAGAYDEARWQAWERTGAARVMAVPGAPQALAAIRKAGLTVIFNTNRSVVNADATAQAIEGAGLGPAVHKETLWLRGDVDAGSGKDSRRTLIATRYCVVAMVGDQLGDFSDFFNHGLSVPLRRATAESPSIRWLWGNGWFVLPNPVYGTALKGGFDDVFPIDKRWTDPATQESE